MQESAAQMGEMKSSAHLRTWVAARVFINLSFSENKINL